MCAGLTFESPAERKNLKSITNINASRWESEYQLDEYPSREFRFWTAADYNFVSGHNSENYLGFDEHLFRVQHMLSLASQLLFQYSYAALRLYLAYHSALDAGTRFDYDAHPFINSDEGYSVEECYLHDETHEKQVLDRTPAVL